MANPKSSKDRGKEDKGYIPGMYKKERPMVYETVENAFQDWKKSRKLSSKKMKKKFPIICLSRKIGAGALEIADNIAKKINYRVVDREVLEHLAAPDRIDDKLSAFFNERCPNEINDLLAKLFGVTAFTQNEYSRLLFRTIFSVAELGPLIFVGRGAHLILPRNRVLSVRLICSNEYRVQRLADNLKISKTAAILKLNHFDVGQKNFFRRIYNLKEASPYEFDMVINRDYIPDAHQVAEIVETAFMQKFKINT